RRERVGLPTGAIEAEHQLTDQPLAKGVLGDEPLEFAHQLRATAQLQLSVDPPLEREQPPLLEPLRLHGDGPLRPQIREGLPTPQGERVAETIPRRGGITCGGGRASLLEQRLEALEVELTRRETEAVTRRATLYPIAAEERPQPRDVGVERTLGAL